MLIREEFYRLYIPALKKALSQDHINYGFYVKSPEDFIQDDLISDVENYIESNEDQFLDQVAYYFDAKSHGFLEVQGLPVEEFKCRILAAIEKGEYRLLKKTTATSRKSDENNDLLDNQFIG